MLPCTTLRYVTLLDAHITCISSGTPSQPLLPSSKQSTSHMICRYLMDKVISRAQLLITVMIICQHPGISVNFCSLLYQSSLSIARCGLTMNTKKLKHGHTCTNTWTLFESLHVRISRSSRKCYSCRTTETTTRGAYRYVDIHSFSVLRRKDSVWVIRCYSRLFRFWSPISVRYPCNQTSDFFVPETLQLNFFDSPQPSSARPTSIPSKLHIQLLY